MKELIFPAEINELDNVLEFINAELEAGGCPMKTQIQIDVAVEELFVNIANYAYKPGKGDATVCIDVGGEPVRAMVRLIDGGIAYNPLEKADPDVTLDISDRSIGGLGIYMVKKSMDKLEYEHKDSKNILTIYKYI